jgi:hypothetical protein
MDRKEVAEFLSEIEKKYPVDEWTIDGVHVWPIVKFNIFIRWRSVEYKKYNSLLKKSSEKVKSKSRVATLFISFKHLFKLLFKKRAELPILFAGANTYRVDFEGESINRYFQPITEYLRAQFDHDFLLTEYTPQNDSKNYKSRDKLLFLDLYFPAARFLQYFNTRRSEENLPGFEAFLNDFRAKMPELVKSMKYLKILRARIKELKAYEFIYNILFDKHSPRYAISLCYYSLPIYAMNRAAQKRGIVSVDMQHGGIGYTHPAYSNYSKVPSSGFNVMPKIFWCWDTASARAIETWSSKQKFHRVIVGGNPWSSYFKNTKTSYKFPDKKIILYTLQLNFPEAFIVEAIRNTPGEYQWWLRLHPRTLSMKEDLKEFLIREGIYDKVEIDNAVLYPLPQILLNSVIHVSRSSGSIIEASQLGVKSVIIHETGVDNYRDYIENNEAISFLKDSPDELLKTIIENEKPPASPGDNQSFDYRSVIDDFLEK